MSVPAAVKNYEAVDLTQIPAVPCPCGTSRRGFIDVPDFPGTLHRTEIASDARLHYHKWHSETYYFLECGPDAKIQIDDEYLAVKPGMSVFLRPGARHRAIGVMTVLILSLPKFDPADEWFD
jgi:quercetin dioxygenase-like cupin family protein